ncbi:MAG TPA: VWA domain-containing protein [Bryobacteraceae bacterium]|nr:VWA domain-containing protein [Bryobacteraceae bacterium]
MTRHRFTLPVAGLLLLLAAAFGFGQQHEKVAASVPSQQPYTISTTSRLVLLDVSVKDSAGGFVSGLTKENFKVYEDGKLQQISQFASVDIPVTVGILVDESGSMRNKRPEVITAALAFIQASNPMDEIFVINFNEHPYRGLPEGVLFSDDPRQLRQALGQGDPEGRTALYDAITMGLHQLELGRRDKKTLVLISDGGDNHSKSTLPEVTHDVLASIATIYTVGIYDPQDPEKNPGVLRRLAQLSGGSFHFPEKLDEIVPICRRIAKDIRTRYTIGYVPAAEGRAQRHIKVVALAADGHKLNVRARTSYWYGSPDSGAAVQ